MIPVSNLVTAIAVAAAALMIPVGLPACEYEDGNTDGSVCVWTDPDTGRQFFNDSNNYREAK